MQSTTPERLAELDRWWGDRDWRQLIGTRQIEVAQVVARRFQKEPGYAYANWWPIYLREDTRKKAFTLIHAADHPEAPKLMRRAFGEIYGDKEGSPTGSQKDLFGARPPGGI